jgi:hypothetical protein
VSASGPAKSTATTCRNQRMAHARHGYQCVFEAVDAAGREGFVSLCGVGMSGRWLLRALTACTGSIAGCRFGGGAVVVVVVVVVVAVVVVVVFVFVFVVMVVTAAITNTLPSQS